MDGFDIQIYKNLNFGYPLNFFEYPPEGVTIATFSNDDAKNNYFLTYRRLLPGKMSERVILRDIQILSNTGCTNYVFKLNNTLDANV